MVINSTDIGKQVEILARYFIDAQTLATPAGFSAALYRSNLDGMLAELHEAGFQNAAVVAVAGDGPITHRDGAFLNYHLVVVDGERVLDPLCGEREPLEKSTYAARAFPGEIGVHLWKQTRADEPGKYQTMLQ